MTVKAEAAAARVVEAALHVTTSRRDRDGLDGWHDYDLRYRDGRPDAALEVTLATHADLVEMNSRRRDGDTVIEAPDLDLNWSVSVRHPRARIKRVRPKLMPHLRRLEAAGLDTVGPIGGPARDPLLTELPVLAAHGYPRRDRTIPSKVVISRPPQGASSNPANLFSAVRAEVDRKADGSLRRAADRGYAERHLFVVADTTWRFDIELPLRYHGPDEVPAPILPASITHIWLAADVLDFDGQRAVVWTAARGERWRSVDVPDGDLLRTVG